MKLKHLLQALPLSRVIGNPDIDITMITADSRQIRTGGVFVAVRGLTVDAHRFVPQVVASGAAAVVVDHPMNDCSATQVIVRDTQDALAFLSSRFYGDPTQSMRMIGVTGTKGKTTTSFLINDLLAGGGYKTSLVGTVQMRIGDQVVPSQMTTPDAVTLQNFFAQAVEQAAGHTIMEVSSHALVQKRVGGCSFDVAVFTNLSHDHLDFHHTMERYLAAKALLFSHLGSSTTDSHKGCKAAVLNADDPASTTIIEQTGVPIITYGIQQMADIRAKDIRLTPQMTTFTCVTPNGDFPVELPLVGLFNVYNSLAALAVGLVEGLSMPAMVDRLRRFPGVPGRFEKIDQGQDFTVIVDYAHTPDSLSQVLETIRGFARGRIIVAFGCTGDRDRIKRPIMGELAARLADVVIITSDDPHSEDPGSIAQEVAAGIAQSTPHEVIVDRHRAIARALELAAPGDVVLIAGKGHERVQIFKDYSLPFVDQEVIREELAKLGWK